MPSKHKKTYTYHPYYTKIYHFARKFSKNAKYGTMLRERLVKRILCQKCFLFRTRKGEKMKDGKPTFKVQDVIDKFTDHPKCALTGRIIDAAKGGEYHFDHKIPVSKGGDNSLDNLQILHRDVNQAKHNLTNEEFINLCLEVIEYNGYYVKRKKHWTEKDRRLY